MDAIVNVELLRAIANATAANAVVYVSKEDGLPLLQNNPPLIDVNGAQTDPSDPSKVAARITEGGVKFLADHVGHSTPKPITAQFSVQSGGLVLPKVKRGGGFGAGAPVKYPFETMAVNDYFFVANSAVAKGDAFKTMGSAVGSANQRYQVDVIGPDGKPETHEVTRVKRGEGNKALKDANGQNVKETVIANKKQSTRKFTVRAVQAGVEYGTFTAPSDGAVIVRSE
jgi:hypothetical protein